MRGEAGQACALERTIRAGAASAMHATLNGAPRPPGPVAPCSATSPRRGEGVRRALAVLSLLAVTVAGGCVRTSPSSFQALGVPDPEVRPGRASVMLGWDREDRQGWSIDWVRIDGERLETWNDRTEAPVLLFLPPGRREVRLGTSQRRDRETVQGRRRRYRPSPTVVEVAAGEVHLCAVRLADGRRPRPRLECMARLPRSAGKTSGRYEPPTDHEWLDVEELRRAEEPDRVELLPSPYGFDDSPAASSAPARVAPALEAWSERYREAPDLLTTPYAPAGARGRASALEARVERLERLVEQLLEATRDAGPGPHPTGPPPGAIDPTPPW